MAQIKQFKLPDVGEGLTEGEILQWLVAVGDTVTINQPIVEVETAKAAVELPCPYAGVVTELLYDEGTTVDVGSPIISIDTDPSGSSGAVAPAAPAAEDAEPPTGVERQAVAAEAPPPSAETLAEVTVAGDDEAIEPGLIGGPAPGGRTSVLVGYGPRTVEAKRRPRVGSRPADKAASAAARTAAGGALRAAAADPTRTNAVQVSPDELQGEPSTDDDDGATSAEPASSAAAAQSGAESGAESSAQSPAASPTGNGATALAKPPVRKYAKSLGVDLSAVTGTGPQDSITRADVDLAASVDSAAQRPGEPVSQPASSGTPAAESAPTSTSTPVFDASREQRIPIKGVRKHTAAAMVSSAFTAPHVTEWITIDVTPMMKLRDRVAGSREFRGVKVSPLVFVAKGLMLAVGRHPMVNSTWDEAAQEIVVKEYVNLGIAAATPRGLIVPNVKDAGRLSLYELASSLNELTEVARSGKTAPADMSGGTITITNVGVFGVDTGTPILNPGESAILAFGAVREQPWVHKGKIRKRQITTLGLSFDHRIVDGELGSRFLADLAGLLADPGQALTY
ncbi:MAG: 2-oxo acid dehydrogenase subunit E2 [Actinomycetota bacterium]|nr:2-oxo acid dehydrogenase subunit E2 [Actinomycetota bacterium]